MSTVVEVRNLTKSYGSVTAVDQVSFSIEAGKIYGLLGRNGAGKTTIMQIITSIILLVIVFLAAFIPTIVQLITAGPTSQTQIVMVNDAGSVAGLDEAKLTAYISSELNGTTTGSRAPYAISSQPAASLGSLQNQVKNGKLDILLVLDRVSNQNLRLTYDTSASATNDSNLSTIQALAQLLTFLDTAHRLGLTSQETQRLVAPPDLIVMQTQQSQNTQPVSEIAAGFVLAYAGAILIYVSIGPMPGSWRREWRKRKAAA